jgi:hypothetical protein
MNNKRKRKKKLSASHLGMGLWLLTFRRDSGGPGIECWQITSYLLVLAYPVCVTWSLPPILGTFPLSEIFQMPVKWVK